MPVPPPAGPTAVIVVNYGSHALIHRNVGALDLTSSDDHVVVVVDNFSAADERRAVERLAGERGWKFVALAGNRGFAAGVNAGAALATGLGAGCLVLLNPDACASRAVIDSLARAVADDPAVIVTPVLRSPLRGTVDRGSVVDLRTGRVRQAGTVAPEHARSWIPATCMAVGAAMFARLGGFDEAYFMYWEDVDFSVRAARAGARLVVDEGLEAVHDSGGTQTAAGGRAKSALYYRYNCRNRLRFAARHLSNREIIRWLIHTPNESWRIVLQGGRRQLLQSAAPLWAMLAGSSAGTVAAVAALVGRRPALTTTTTARSAARP